MTNQFRRIGADCGYPAKSNTNSDDRFGFPVSDYPYLFYFAVVFRFLSSELAMFPVSMDWRRFQRPGPSNVKFWRRHRIPLVRLPPFAFCSLHFEVTRYRIGEVSSFDGSTPIPATRPFECRILTTPSDSPCPITPKWYLHGMARCFVFREKADGVVSYRTKKNPLKHGPSPERRFWGYILARSARTCFRIGLSEISFPNGFSRWTRWC